MNVVKRLRWRLFLLCLSCRMIIIRKKDKIRFLFVLQELSQWKTEQLYIAMREHERFEPIIGVTQCREHPGAEQRVIAYCEEKQYSFIILDPEKTIKEQVNVDMLCHQKPYLDNIHAAHQIDSNKSIPTVYISYFLSTIVEPWVVNQRTCILAWHQFIENTSCQEAWKKINKLKGFNYVVTGSPMMDELLASTSTMKDVWPVSDGRKRIIWAPHHTIGDYHMVGMAYSTFLDICWFMLELKKKYRNQVYFVFKPHPLLYPKLCAYWGKERTDAYWEQWRTMENSHVEEGEYIGLMKHSDAMIHDCGSFTLEYLFTANPVMYLLGDAYDESNQYSHVKEAFALHEKGRCHEDIDRFIGNVVKGLDPQRKDRMDYVKRHLTPPYGRTACDNIICAILGEKEYK